MTEYARQHHGDRASPTAIDLAPLITEAGGRALKGDDYTRATDFLHNWHAGDANEHGVFMDTERVALAKAGRCAASARIAQTGRGHWLAGHGFEADGYCYSGSSPGVWDSLAFTTRDEAIQHERDHAARWFSSLINDRSAPEAVRRDAEKIVAALQAEPKPQQLTMF